MDDMDQKLMELVDANSDENRRKWASDWKASGGKIVGTLCSYVPDEIIHAAGLLPWRVTGVWDQNIAQALVYRPAGVNPYYTHVLEGRLRGDLDFLDALVASDWELDQLHSYDVWIALPKTRTDLSELIHVPYLASELACRKFADECNRTARSLGEFAGIAITEERLRASIDVLNRTRFLIRELYELRKKDLPSLSGAEFLGITTAATIMPREQFNSKLEALLPFLRERRASVAKTHPRLLLSSDFLDHPANVKLIEEAGCLVAMDDLDTGARRFWHTVEVDGQGSYYALAKSYLTRPACPRMSQWIEQADRLVAWCREFAVDGVVELILRLSTPRAIRVPFMRTRLAAAGIPHCILEVDYVFGDYGPLKTRIEAFLEMLEGGLRE